MGGGNDKIFKNLNGDDFAEIKNKYFDEAFNEKFKNNCKYLKEDITRRESIKFIQGSVSYLKHFLDRTPSTDEEKSNFIYCYYIIAEVGHLFKRHVNFTDENISELNNILEKLKNDKKLSSLDRDDTATSDALMENETTLLHNLRVKPEGALDPSTFAKETKELLKKRA
jgi:hypothetical protein